MVAPGTKPIPEDTMAPRTPKPPEDKPAKAAKAPARATGKDKPVARPGKPDLKVVAKPAAARPAAAEAPATLAAAAAKGSAGVLKLKTLVEQVAAATGASKPEAKRAVGATLAAIAAGLKAGTDLNLPPLGKLRLARSSGAVLTLKLRTAGAGKAAAKPLADDGEDD